MSRSRRSVPAAVVPSELLPGSSIGLLKELHLLTRDGQLNADARRKLKQINHLLRLLDPASTDLLERFPAPVIVDVGAGKSYLGFLLAELRLAPAEKGTLFAVESRPELAAATAARASRLGLSMVRSVAGELTEVELPERVHLVTALHACDTATDDALVFAIRRGADHVAVVPCCQAEAAEQLRSAPAGVFTTLGRHALHRRELGAHLTNAIRALTLEAHGYEVTVTELVGLEHSLKNELILGRRVRRYDEAARARLADLLLATGLRLKLTRDLEAAGAELTT